MSQRISAKLTYLVWLSFIATLVVAPPAQAYSTYELTAVSNTSQWTSFSVRYVDLDSDAKFDWNELVMDSFKGVKRATDLSTISFHALASKPSGSFLYPENWVEVDLRDEKSPFFDDLSLFFIAEVDVGSSLRNAWSGNWTFSQMEVVPPSSAVPLPGSLPLLGIGLLSLAAYKRRKISC
jgi:hypothetical protein